MKRNLYNYPCVLKHDTQAPLIPSLFMNLKRHH